MGSEFGAEIEAEFGPEFKAEIDEYLLNLKLKTSRVFLFKNDEDLPHECQDFALQTMKSIKNPSKCKPPIFLTISVASIP